MNPILFLDIDGVLNDGTWLTDAKSFHIKPQCVKPFNRIIKEIHPDIVLTSAWRYMILAGTMTTQGFQFLLRSHGVSCDIHIIGITPQSEFCRHCKHVNVRGAADCEKCGEALKRGQQITSWLHGKIRRNYLVIDDHPHDIRAHRHPLLLTDGTVGLTETDATTAIAMLAKASSEPMVSLQQSNSAAGIWC